MKTYFFTNIPAPYRESLFLKLEDLLAGDVVFYFDSLNEDNRKWSLEQKFKFKSKILDSPKIVFHRKNNHRESSYLYFPYRVLIECIFGKPKIIISSEMGIRSAIALLASKIIRSHIYIFSDVTTLTEKNISKLKTSFRRSLCKHFTGAIAHGTLSKEYLQSLGFKEEDITVSHFAIPIEHNPNDKIKTNIILNRKQLGIDEDAFIFTYVGQFIYRKGIDLLINAIKLARKEHNITLLLAGGTETELYNLVDNIDKTYIKVLGFLCRNELVSVYKLANCFILPTRLDTWGIVVNEAIACYCPVAVSKYAGCSYDLINDGIDGYIFDPKDEENFVKTINTIVMNRKNLPSMAARALEKQHEFSYDTAAERISELIIRKTCP